MKIAIVKYLLEEIEAEQLLFRNHEEAFQAARSKAIAEGKEFYNYMRRWEGRAPSKARIRLNALKIRQLMMDITKSVDEL